MGATADVDKSIICNNLKKFFQQQSDSGILSAMRHGNNVMRFFIDAADWFKVELSSSDLLSRISGLFLASVTVYSKFLILLFHSSRVRFFLVLMKKRSIALSSYLATPSKISCIGSCKSYFVTRKSGMVASTDLPLIPHSFDQNGLAFSLIRQDTLSRCSV
jgi:hypothetical protein